MNLVTQCEKNKAVIVFAVDNEWIEDNGMMGQGDDIEDLERI